MTDFVPAVPGPEIRPLELAGGLVFGPEESEPMPSTGNMSPLGVLEEVLAEALSRPPCVVSFSGGRDSSAMLAVAAKVARANGLPMPIASTLVFPTASETDETAWQELVLGHLGITDWVKTTITDELDVVGPYAAKLLRRHGVLWPSNVHCHLPIIEQTPGGTVVTGFGGDELGISTKEALAERILWKRDMLRSRGVLVVGLAFAPKAVRGAIYRRRAADSLPKSKPWLTQKAITELSVMLGESAESEPRGWDNKVRRGMWPDRYFRLIRKSFDLMGANHDTKVLHPFVDGRVMDALARTGGYRGFSSRSEIMQRIFGDILPEQLVNRPTKARFGSPLWTETSRRFASMWKGDGVDQSLVDAARLKEHWSGTEWSIDANLLLQQLWLKEYGDKINDGQ